MGDLSSANPTSEKSISSQNAPVYIIPLIQDKQSKNSVLPKLITFEEILEKLGCFGRFQVLCMCLYLCMEVTCVFIAFIPIFVTRSTIPENCTKTDRDDYMTTTESYQLDNKIIEISSRAEFVPTSVSSKWSSDNFQQTLESFFQYDSLVDEWDLKCDRAWVPATFTTVMMAGMLVGSLGSSQLADWYGRRRPFIAIIIVKAIGLLLCAFSPSMYVYFIGRFVAGAGFSGFICISCMACMEFMTPKWRSVANCAGPLGEGVIILSILGYYFRPWRMLYLSTLFPFVSIIPIYMFLPESPRWLLSNGRTKEAYEILCSMARINKREPISLELLIAYQKQEELSTKCQKSKHMSYLEFIKTKSLLVTSLYLFFVWFAWNMGYYGMMYNMKNVPGDPYFNLGLIGIATAIGQRVSFVLCNRLGRRRAVLAAMSFSASFLVAMALCFITMTSVDATIILAGCFFGLLGLSCSRACIRLLSGESFPTAVRMMGLSFGGLGANFSGLITPQLAYLGSKSPPLPFFIFAGISVAGSFMVFMMQETNGTPLSDNIQQQVSSNTNTSASKRL